MLEYYQINKGPIAYVTSCIYLGALVCLVQLMHFLIAYFKKVLHRGSQIRKFLIIWLIVCMEQKIARNLLC